MSQHDPTVVALLRAAQIPTQRQAALDALAQYPIEELILVLNWSAPLQELTVRAGALDALAQYGRDAIEPLLHAVGSGSAISLRDTIVAALLRIPRATQEITVGAFMYRDGVVRRGGLQVLPQLIPLPQATAILLPAMMRHERHERHGAVAGLAYVVDAAATAQAALQQCAVDDPDRTVRAAAATRRTD